MPHSNTENHIRGLIKRSSEMPEDFIATNSKLSPRLPKVMIEEISMAIGIANIRSDALAYHKNCPIVSRSRSLPTRSSMYFHRLCIINTNNAIKKVTTKGPINDLRISLSNFFIIRPVGQLAYLFNSYVYLVNNAAKNKNNSFCQGT
jgi:hypothetical protein